MKNKKRILGVIIAILLSLVLTTGCQFWVFVDIFNDKTTEPPIMTTEPPIVTTEPPIVTTEPPTTTTEPPVSVDTDELSIHFLELGNRYSGDSVYIKIGDVDILVDAGSRKDSADDIANYVDRYCTDGTLEYVIVTHAHQDHIAGFVGSSSVEGIFDRYVCETIIDFPRTNADSVIYGDYLEKRDAEVAAGAKHYTALECYDNENGAQRVYELAENVTLEILYNYYYENKTSNENEYSVCFLINQGNNHYLFTGDLESDGEEKLVQLNNLPHCVLFKAGHHGSYTATSYALLDEITPEIVCVTCVCGSDEYTDNMDNMFPSQAFCSRVSAYTDRVYVTSIATDNDKGYASLNGTIVVSSKGGEVSLSCSASDELFKDSQWCLQHRVWGES